MKTRFVITALALLAALFAAGCDSNIFEFSSGDSAESLIDEGRGHLRDGDYEEAEAKFAEAMEMEPQNSDARYLHAKAVMQASDFNALNLGAEIGEVQFATGDELPFSGDDWPSERVNTLYSVVNQVYADLRPIYYGETTGNYGPADVDFDLGIIASIKGILSFRDTNVDGTIDDNDFDLRVTWDQDGFSLTGFYLYLAGYMSQGTYRVEPALTATADPLPDFLILAANELIDNIATVIAEAYDIIVSIATGEFGLDLSEVQDFLIELVAVAPQYRIADGLDNDGDGSVDEEVINLIDDDGDGRVDEDSNGLWEPQG